MSKNDTINLELYGIIFEKKILYLDCPKCKNIPYLSFNLGNPKQINIKCDQCNKSFLADLNNYLKDLKAKNLFQVKKCDDDKNFLDTFCYDCYIQYCSKCATNKMHDGHYTKRIKKNFNSENIETVKEKIEDLKKYFKNYILSFINQYNTKFPKKKLNFTNNNLLKHYIQDMKNFFHFCDCILLNYDIEYPDYYQQYNLNNLIDTLNEITTLKNLNEKNFKRLFRYRNNNFISNNEKDEGNNLILLYSLNDFNDKIITTFLVNDELIIILFKDCLKLYNYKNQNFISKLDMNLSNKEIKLTKINKDKIGLILSNKNNNSSLLQLYLITSNKIIFQKSFDFYIQNIKNIDNNSFAILKEDSLEVYTLNENSKSSELQMIKYIKISYLYDFIYLSNENYLITLGNKNIIAYDKDYNIIKRVEVNEKFTTIYGTDDKFIILGGRIIGLLNINNWSYSIIFDDHIPYSQKSYLAVSYTFMKYSHFNLTSFNSLICKQNFREMLDSHFDDLGDGVVADENNLCIFDFNPVCGQMTKIYTNKNLNPENIYINEDDEIIVEKENCINVYEIV